MGTVLVDTAVLVGIRAGFFLAARRFLLGTLNPTLRDLSDPDALSLPRPITATTDESGTESYPSSPLPRTDVVELVHPEPRRKGGTANALGQGRERKQGGETKGLNRAARYTRDPDSVLPMRCRSLRPGHSGDATRYRSAVPPVATGQLLRLAPHPARDDRRGAPTQAVPPIHVPITQELPFPDAAPRRRTGALWVVSLPLQLDPTVCYRGNGWLRVARPRSWEGGRSGRYSPRRVIGIRRGPVGMGFLPTFSAPVAEDEVLQAERSLFRIRQDLESKQLAESGWKKRLWGDGEHAGLVAMEREASRSLVSLKERRQAQLYGQTVGGQLYNILGYAFAIYCAARVLMCLPSVFFSTSVVDPATAAKGNTNGDWISVLIAFGLSKLPIDVDVAVWSRAISLAFTGLIILSSLAQILRSLSRILKLTSKSIGAGFLLLTLGQLFATYIISLLVQLRTSIPGNPDHDDSLLSSLPDFRIFGRLFDLVFLTAATSTLVYRFIASKIS